MPTFNDLYWEGSGNPDLKPESSYQAEIGNEFIYKEFFCLPLLPTIIISKTYSLGSN